jgi:hypothetical protein
VLPVCGATLPAPETDQVRRLSEHSAAERV